MMQRMNIRQVLAILLLIVGVQFWLLIGHGMWGRDYSKWLTVGVFAVCLIPQLRGLLSRAIDATRNPSPTTRRLIAIVIAIGATVYFVLTAREQGIEFVPRIHDESSYLIQTRMILHGRLWESQHPLADFFESFHILTKPVYASKYFPGTALLYAPGLAIGLAYWLLPAMAAGATVGLVYRVVGELTDGAGGLLAALMMIGCSALRRASVLYMSTAPIMLLTMLAIWAYLHWRRSPKPIWAALIGFFLSWALITRPLDAICFAIPIGVAVLVEARRITPRLIAGSLAAAVIAAVPLLALQIVCNTGITGRWSETAWTMYTQDDDPFDGMAIGALDPSLKSQSTLPQKIEFSEGFTKGAAQQRRGPGRLGRFVKDDLNADFDVMLPHPLFMILLPVGLLAVLGVRGVLYATLPLCVIAYAFYTFSVPQYLVIAAPAAAMGVVLGIEAIASVFPQISTFARTFLSLSIVALVLTQLPQFNPYMTDDMFRTTDLKAVAQMLDAIDRKPAVVLFHYQPGKDNPHIEPVYNTDVAWPDDALVIRAHDLGARNVEIFRYYPDRAFYMCNPRFSAPRYLGTGRELADGTPR
jgi:hypothetical protein